LGHPAAGRRGAAGPARGWLLPGPDRRLLRAGGSAAHAVAWFRRRPAGPAGAHRVLRPGRRTQSTRRVGDLLMGNYSFEVADIFVEPYAAAPQLTARLR